MKHTILIALPALALIACGQQTDTQSNIDAPSENVVLPADEGSMAGAPSPEGTDTTEADVIPAGLRGRWGMNANDCDPAQASAAKGLMEIDDTSIKFYESRAVVTSIEDREDTRIKASFDMTGEGMTWQRDMTLDVQDGGNTLIRREYGEGALPGPLKYQRCTA